MDRQLAERLNNLSMQNEVLFKARSAYLLMEARRKHFEAKMIRAADGKSQAEKTVSAQAAKEWLDFHLKLSELESQFEFEKTKYEILDKAYLAEYATFKSEEHGHRRQA